MAENTLLMLSTTSSLELSVARSRQALSEATSSTYALKAGKRLIGQFPNAKPHDPEVYAASIGAVLAQYPLGIVEECCDPRVGLARVYRYAAPNVSDVVSWCDQRLAWHRKLAAYVPPRPRPALAPPPRDPETRARVAEFWAKLSADLKSRWSMRPPAAEPAGAGSESAVSRQG